MGKPNEISETRLSQLQVRILSGLQKIIKMKTEKEKIELEIKKLTDKRDNSSDTFTRIKLSQQIKKLKENLEKLI